MSIRTRLKRLEEAVAQLPMEPEIPVEVLQAFRRFEDRDELFAEVARFILGDDPEPSRTVFLPAWRARFDTLRPLQIDCLQSVLAWRHGPPPPPHPSGFAVTDEELRVGMRGLFAPDEYETAATDAPLQFANQHARQPLSPREVEELDQSPADVGMVWYEAD